MALALFIVQQSLDVAARTNAATAIYRKFPYLRGSERTFRFVLTAETLLLSNGYAPLGESACSPSYPASRTRWVPETRPTLFAEELGQWASSWQLIDASDDS